MDVFTEPELRIKFLQVGKLTFGENIFMTIFMKVSFPGKFPGGLDEYEMETLGGKTTISRVGINKDNFLRIV